MPRWVALLRQAVEDSNYSISDHALQRMGERGITVDDVEGCICEGEVVGKQDHGWHVKWLIRGHDEEDETFLTVVALSWPKPVIVTVMRDHEDSSDSSSTEATGQS